MVVLDPGHRYLLRHLDGDGHETLTFVKREGAKYPGNVGSHPGTTMQEVLRALIERASYVQEQLPCDETGCAIGLLETALYLFESRAARRHGRPLPELILDDMIDGKTCCPRCGHIGCDGACHAKESKE